MATRLSGFTLYQRPETTPTPSGTAEKDIYEYEVNDVGQKKLVITGTKNVYEEIQTYAEDVKIENILKRVAIGDMSDFRPNGIFADTTKMPNNLIEAKKQMVKLENTWNKLPINIKEKYNNSLDEFIGKAGTKVWMEDMGLLNPEAEATPTIAETVPETKVPIPDEA